MTLIRSGVPTLVPEVNWGRWISGCPRCPSALALSPGQALFECRDCGQAAEILWPPAETVYAVERLLMLRPDESTRNWTPDETLHDLVLENAVHGLLGAPDQTGLVIGVDNHGIRDDRLPIPARALKEVCA